ncbi:hypothetical protein COU16_00635 [Candidatus Kaiserbacteria bacterium CG10_big_fil_rev_8_21_14_0_10_47_16]|uniref:Uncharacterized protein n=1 Tax=Candidatus Kaiserbacteria bacterium CG10_big_fil_rev_8_21_14_0_10_47_16 TaxID=1974608 RepID=A0A2H0UGR8_9BACT|nr:MAG: hypothetical protein COU16_00635 [Candidatus Kaiserbacteria bacterium CG10_big_fil_rev_8_21_14_0_10_47_16]
MQLTMNHLGFIADHLRQYVDPTKVCVPRTRRWCEDEGLRSCSLDGLQTVEEILTDKHFHDGWRRRNRRFVHVELIEFYGEGKLHTHVQSDSILWAGKEVPFAVFCHEFPDGRREWFSVRPSMTFVLPRNTPHAFRARAHAPLRLLAVSSPPLEASDVVNV